ncbi:MAG: hypothetical protein U0263_17615 [Polyangiaceae bacterium]
MRRTGWVLLVLVACACGGESDDGGSSTGGSSGSGGATGGSSGTGGATGGASGSGGATGGSSGAGATGGASGSGGTTGGTGGATGGTGGGTASPECKEAADCQVFEDCCSCDGVPKGTNPPMCKLACTEKKCSVLGVSSTEVSCVAGRCVKGYECDSTKVACAAASPACSAGEVPQVKGACWTGKCVPASECASVAGCKDCDTTKYACVENVAKPSSAHCVDVPAACGGSLSCACFGASVCVSPYTSCSELSGVKGVSCGCPTC